MNLQSLLSPLTADVTKHPLLVVVGVVAWWGFSGAVGYLPAPKPMGSPFYAAFYGAAHGIAGNVKTFLARFQSKI